MSDIKGLADLRPGDIMFGPIGGAVGLGVGLGQLALRESFRVGRLSIRHVGIVVESSRLDVPYADLEPGDRVFRTSEADVGQRMPRLVQAMPHGAEEIVMTAATHWTPRHAYVRLLEDYPGQAADAASIARLMVAEGVAYSPASYFALAAWLWGLRTPRLERWIGRCQEVLWTPPSGRAPAHLPYAPGPDYPLGLPREAICSVLVDRSWSLTGKRVVEDTKPQIVTPGMMAGQLWRRPGTTWAGPGLL